MVPGKQKPSVLPQTRTVAAMPVATPLSGLSRRLAEASAGRAVHCIPRTFVAFEGHFGHDKPEHSIHGVAPLRRREALHHRVPAVRLVTNY